MNMKMPNNMNEMSVINMKSQMALMSAMQKVGKGKRKVTLELNRTNQRFLSSFMKEFKKTLEKESTNKVNNILSFADYIIKNTESTRKNKKPKIVLLLISYEEQDFLRLQMAETVNAIRETRKTLKWYNLIKKITYSSYQTQCSEFLEVLKSAK